MKGKSRYAIAVVVSILLLIHACAQPCEEVVKADCVCTFEYNPVCACNGKTYGNACEAACSGITDYSPGACE